METMEQVNQRMKDLETKLRERGVVDIKFSKTSSYYQLSPLEKAQELCDVIDCVLEGRFSPAEPIGDSVREPNMLSPVARCGGGHLGDHHEEQETSGKTAS